MINNIPILLKPQWIQGFFQFTSTFQFRIAKTKTRSTYYTSAHPTFEVSFPKHSDIILHCIKNYFHSGFVKSYGKVSRLIFTDEEIIINFLNNYPLMGHKNEVYKNWKKLIAIKMINKHKSDKGLHQIIELGAIALKKSINQK